MSEHIDQFCENLRIKLTNIDNNMESLKSKIDGKARTAEQDVRRHLDGVKKRIEQDRGNVAAAQADIKKWIEERKATASEKVAELKAKRETAQLQNRANSAERYAAGAAVVALAAIDEAERASLEAWLARKDAENTQGTKAA
jgi:predicted  nucleic acid-binding Zn-ribbon protein